MDPASEEVIEDRRQVIARARQNLRRVEARLSRSRAERILAAVEQRQRRDADERAHVDHLDTRSNHWRSDERRIRRRHNEVTARARKLLGKPQVYRPADDSPSQDDCFDFVLATSTPDRYDRVIVLEGLDLGGFLLNPIALWNHDETQPIGFWENTHIVDGELRARLELLPKGTSAKADEARKLVTAGVLRACSIGIHPLEWKRRPRSRYGGRTFLRSELMECSLVPIGANRLAVRRLECPR